MSESNKKETKVDILKKLDGVDEGDNELLPEKLRLYVSQEIWNSWSPIRRDSFKQILKNPNSFFYRNRPPGDPQKYGHFTPEEEKQFIERLQYFRKTLKINDGLWGLFSVPIRGRLGYQCSNFYRQLIREGKLRDYRYSIESDGKLRFNHGGSASIPPESIRILEKEAFDFIQKSISGENGTPIVSAPIQIKTQRQVHFKPFSNRNTTRHISSGGVIVGGGGGCLSQLFGKRRKNLREKRFDPTLVSDEYNEEKPRRPRKEESIETSVISSRCPLCGAIDPMSNEPITNPMMDCLGFVMDLRSWRRVFRRGEPAPCPLVAESESDLIQITPMNFEQLRLLVSNFAC